MRILHILPASELAGTERAALELIRAMRPLGHDSAVMSLLPFGALAPILQAEAIPCHEVNPRGWRGWRTYFSLRRQLPGIAADLLLISVLDLDAFPALHRSPARRRVLMAHGPHPGKSRQYWRWAYRAALQVVDTVIFCTDFLREEAESMQPLLKGRSHVVFNPVPVQPEIDATMRSSARRVLGLPQDSLVLGCAGRLTPGKRFDVFLDVAAAVAAGDRSAHFVIAGGGPDEAQLRRRADSLGIGGRVHWLGWQPDVSDFYRSLDGLLFHSDNEPFGLVAAEAMARGIPVIASIARGGLREVLRHGEDGICLASHDVGALAEAALQLRAESARSMAASGRRRIAEICSPMRAANAILGAAGCDAS